MPQMSFILMFLGKFFFFVVVQGPKIILLCISDKNRCLAHS